MEREVKKKAKKKEKVKVKKNKTTRTQQTSDKHTSTSLATCPSFPVKTQCELYPAFTGFPTSVFSAEKSSMTGYTFPGTVKAITIERVGSSVVSLLLSLVLSLELLVVTTLSST